MWCGQGRGVVGDSGLHYSMAREEGHHLLPLFPAAPLSCPPPLSHGYHCASGEPQDTDALRAISVLPGRQRDIVVVTPSLL